MTAAEVAPPRCSLSQEKTGQKHRLPYGLLLPAAFTESHIFYVFSFERTTTSQAPVVHERPKSRPIETR